MLAATGEAGGAALVGFRASGSATDRTVARKLAEVYTTPEDFGAVPGLGQDATAAVQSAINAVAQRGGGEVRFGPFTYRVTQQIDLLERVDLNLGGGTLRCELSGGGGCGVQVRSYASLRNGRISVVSSGTPGSQAGVHAPVRIGNLRWWRGKRDRPTGPGAGSAAPPRR